MLYLIVYLFFFRKRFISLPIWFVGQFWDFILRTLLIWKSNDRASDKLYTSSSFSLSILTFVQLVRVHFTSALSLDIPSTRLKRKSNRYVLLLFFLRRKHVLLMRSKIHRARCHHRNNIWTRSVIFILKTFFSRICPSSLCGSFLLLGDTELVPMTKSYDTAI